MLLKKASKVLVSVPTVTVGAYTAGFQVGQLLELKNFFESTSGVSEVLNITVSDAANQKAALFFCFFKSKPTGTYTDAIAFAPSAADLQLISAIVPVATTAYTSAASNAVGSVGNIRQKVQAAFSPLQDGSTANSRSCWLAVFTSGTPTYTALCLQFQIGVEQDV